MFENPYYNGIIKQVIVGFGALFSNVKLVRYDSAGTLQQTINVPLAYAPKEHWVTRTDQDPDLENNIYSTLPRMSFEISGYNYDPTRMVNRNHKVAYKSPTINNTVPAPVPYNIDINMYVLTKGTEDGLCLIEQILPIFSPEYTLNFTALPAMNINQEVPIVLNSVSVEDSYEGDFTTRRLVTHTLNFTAKANLYMGVTVGKIITNVTANLDTQTLAAGQEKYAATGNPSTGTVTTDHWL